MDSSISEVVSNPPLGVDILRVGRVLLDLLTQPSDMDIDCADITWIIIAPDKIQQILTAVDLVRIQNQQLQNIEFLCRQIDVLSLGLQPERPSPSAPVQPLSAFCA